MFCVIWSLLHLHLFLKSVSPSLNCLIKITIEVKNYNTRYMKNAKRSDQLLKSSCNEHFGEVPPPLLEGGVRYCSFQLFTYAYSYTAELARKALSSNFSVLSCSIWQRIFHSAVRMLLIKHGVRKGPRFPLSITIAFTMKILCSV